MEISIALITILYTLLAILATYAISFVLVYKSGPFDVFERLRDVSWVSRFGVFDCAVCISFWVSIPVSLLFGIPVFAFIGVWGAVVVLDRLITYHLLK